MMMDEHLSGSWDQPTSTVVMHAQNPTRLQVCSPCAFLLAVGHLSCCGTLLTSLLHNQILIHVSAAFMRLEDCHCQIPLPCQAAFSSSEALQCSNANCWYRYRMGSQSCMLAKYPVPDIVSYFLGTGASAAVHAVATVRGEQSDYSMLS